MVQGVITLSGERLAILRLLVCLVDLVAGGELGSVTWLALLSVAVRWSGHHILSFGGTQWPPNGQC